MSMRPCRTDGHWGVMAALRIAPLEPAEVDEAFAVARLGYPDLPLQGWRRLARRAMRAAPDHHGVLAARDGGGRLNGLLIYTVDPVLRGPPALRIEKLISFDILDPRLTAEALMSQALSLGRARGCEGLNLKQVLEHPADATALVIESGAAALHQVL